MTLEASGQQDSAATLTIRFANGTNRFRVGEVIPIELAFRASVDETYILSTRGYDRSGRLGVETYNVDPPGRDPLHDYYQSGLYPAFMGGGLGSSKFLSSEPHILQADLNEWVALDAPGHYTLHVTSGRVTQRGGPKPTSVLLRSNTLEFEVVEADPAWQEQVLSAARSALTSVTSTDDEKSRAVRTLRFLDSPMGVRELVLQVVKPGGGSRWDFVAGLIGSRQKQLVLRELEAQLQSPDAAITAEYLRLLAQTKFLLSHEPLPPYPREGKEQQARWIARRDKFQKQFTELQDTLYQQAASLIGVKRGAARAETVRTLLLRPTRGPENALPEAGLPVSEITSAFLALSPGQQSDLLQFQWARLKTPAMADALQQILDEPQIRHQQLRSFALQRLHELDPASAGPRILAEIRQPHVDNGIFTVSPKVLFVLSNATLPEMDELLIARLEKEYSHTKGLDGQLIGRYATKAILPRVKVVYEAEPGPGACDIVDGLLTYFLRVDPNYGVRKMQDASSTCLTESLKTVTRMKRWAEIEPAVIQKLNDPNLWLARQAAETLAKYGGVEAKKAMFQRLRSFHQQWAERERELEYVPNQPREASDASSFQYGLVNALGTAQGWLLSDDEITELEKLTLGQQRENVARWHWRSAIELHISVQADGQLTAHIGGQYLVSDMESLYEKLAQFSPGTRFWMNAFGPSEQLAPVLLSIEEVAAQKGLVLERPPAN